MVEYAYRCTVCGKPHGSQSRSPHPCPFCGASARRLWSFNARPSMPDHFNHSLGRYVTNQRDLGDGFKRASDEASERMGIEHNFQPIDRADMADPSAHGVTDEGLEHTRQVLHDARS
jgi:DNA-directed RNA polymerase subunit RPC12/RpoP